MPWDRGLVPVASVVPMPAKGDMELLIGMRRIGSPRGPMSKSLKSGPGSMVMISGRGKVSDDIIGIV